MKLKVKMTYKEANILVQNILRRIITSNNFGMEILDLAEYTIEMKFKVIPVGSYRRKKSLIGDLDFLVIDDHLLFKKFLEVFDKTIMAGDYKLSGIVDGVQVDVYYIRKESLGTSLIWYTGPAEFNIKLAAVCKSKGYSFAPLGITDERGHMRKFRKEKQVFQFLKLRYLSPEKRDVNTSISL